jgi:very-short-patch-repair endonuclease
VPKQSQSGEHLDGDQHDSDKGKKNDKLRDDEMKRQGLRICYVHDKTFLKNR